MTLPKAYTILGLDGAEGHDFALVRQAYRKAVLHFHPDKQRSQPPCNARRTAQHYGRSCEFYGHI